MSNRFNHPTYGAVTILRDFGHYIRVSSSSGTHNIRREELTAIPDPIQFPEGGRLAQSEALPETPPVTIEPDEPPSEPEGQSVANTPSNLIAINKLSANQIAKGLTGVGKLRAKRIVESKPNGGYASFDDLRETLPDLFGDDGDDAPWQQIQPLITYET
jgi:hypothetical protein